MSRKKSQSVEVVMESLRGQMKSGVYPVGAQLPTELWLASEMGYSRGTIRKAIDRLAASGELYRRPHSRPTVSNPTQAVKGKNVYVWVCTPVAHQPILFFLKGVSKALSGTPYRMVVSEPSRFAGSVVISEELQFLKELENADDMAGAILERDAFANHSEQINALLAAGKRLVFVDVPPPDGVEADFVGTANLVAGRSCVEHLLELGHKHILCVSDSDIPQTTRDRIDGFWRAMKYAGLEECGGSLIASELEQADHIKKPVGGAFARNLGSHGYYSDLGCRCVDAILKMDPRPTGLFVTCDTLAFWICAYLEGAGLKVPSDVSVVGFDWLAHWHTLIPDTLTTASQDFEGFGIHAANLLLDRLTGNLSSAPRHILLNAPLIVRSSTASDLVLPASRSA